MSDLGVSAIQHTTNAFWDTSAMAASHYSGMLPSPLKLKLGGLEPEQLRIYEEFSTVHEQPSSQASWQQQQLEIQQHQQLQQQHQQLQQQAAAVAAAGWSHPVHSLAYRSHVDVAFHLF